MAWQDLNARSARAAIITSLLIGTFVLAISVPGLGDPWTYDESVTVGSFVKASSFGEATTTQVVANNHLMATVIAYGAASATGSTSEPLLRGFPVLCFVATAALLAFWATRRIGAAGGVLAGLVFSTSPLAFELGRTLRGYSLMVLCATTATLVLEHIVRRGASRRSTVFYVAVGAVGVAAQLYMLIALAAHLAALLVGGRSTRSQVSLPIWAAVIGAAVQLPLLTATLSAGRGRVFRPTFPLDVGWDVLGRSAVAVACATVLLVAGRRAWAASRSLAAAIVAVLAFGALMWIVAPYDLYARFFVAGTAAIALGVAIGAVTVAHRGRSGVVLATLLALGVLVPQALTIAPHLSKRSLANREIASVLTEESRAGRTTCVLASSAEPLMGYLAPQKVAGEPSIQGCDVIASLIPRWDEIHLDAVRQELRWVLPVDATTPGAIYSRTPICTTDAGCSLPVDAGGP